MKIDVLYEDNHIIVVEKPVNIPVQRDRSNDNDMLTLIKNDLKEKYKKPGNVYLGLVHRLDRPAGGVMVFAKTSKAASRLSRDMREGRLKKNYLAVVHGELKNSSGTLRHFLLKDREANIVTITGENSQGAKSALLNYTMLEYARGLSLINVDLVTGRPHQIRVQLAGTGHPLFGDQKYGAGLNKHGLQLALWSAEIQLTHPVSQQKISFNSSPPMTEPWSFFSVLL